MRLKLKRSFQKRKGFTLLEVLLASLSLAIVATILFGLTTSAHLTTLNITGKIIAQNIAQATLEDIMAQNNYFLDTLIDSSTISSNYPINDGTVVGGYHISRASATISLVGITNSLSEASLAKATSNNFSGTDSNLSINLFNYANPTFTRDITIKEEETTPKSYSIAIIVNWTLNSTPQSLTITGTKN